MSLFPLYSPVRIRKHLDNSEFPYDSTITICFLKVKSRLNPARGIYKILKSAIIEMYNSLRRWEPPTAVRREASRSMVQVRRPRPWGILPEQRTEPAYRAAVGSVGRARYSAGEWAYIRICQPGWYREAPSSHGDERRIYFYGEEHTDDRKGLHSAGFPGA